MKGILEKLGSLAKNRVLSNLAKRIEERNFGFALTKFLEKLNIKPVFLAEERDPEKFKSDREKLEFEAGIVIANHPGNFDAFSVLSAIKRKDVLIVVSAGAHDKLKDSGLDSYVIEVENEPRKIPGFLSKIKDHIANGGIVVMFPTGGSDSVKNSNEQFIFRRGLRVILRKCMSLEDMVYSFYINPDDVKKVSKDISETDMATTALSGFSLKNPNRQVHEIRIDENRSTVSEWLNVVRADTEKVENGEDGVLANHFLSQFKRK